MLNDLAAEAQRLLGQLNVKLEMLGGTLTEDTERVLRAGRLGYDVEVLRGEVRGLEETLMDTIAKDIEVFVPGGLDAAAEQKKVNGAVSLTNGEVGSSETVPPSAPAETQAKETDMAKLRTLTLVRTRLDCVKTTFSEAMDWTFPPSEVSVSSGLISVSAPEPGSEAASTEEKGQEISRKLRAEITDLTSSSGSDGIKQARARIADLRSLAEVWKGTAEEKARMRFVDSLEKIVDDKEAEINRRSEEQRVMADSERPLGVAAAGTGTTAGGALGGYGFMGQLGRIRGGM